MGWVAGNDGVLCFIAAAIALVLFVAPVEAASLESLLMPGAVIAGHAKIEHDCSLCHDRADRGAQPKLCRDCHEDVDRDIA